LEVKAVDNVSRTAIVTGASSGIGLAVSESLCRMGYEVFGFGRNFEREKFRAAKLEEGRFHPVVCDLLDTSRLCGEVKNIMAEHEVFLLVNNAGVGYYGLHEELSPHKIQEMVRVNLEAPMILSQLLLRTLKKNSGCIINISSVTADRINPHGCAYGATKAGLDSFSHSLFEEARKYGVRVASIRPDMTQTNLYRNADFREDDEAAAHLEPQEVAQAVEYVLSQRQGMAVTDITLRPQLHRIKRKGKGDL
jgi:NADP-dependent 3-hydroxy acid dehydrogenase YdfG